MSCEIYHKFKKICKKIFHKNLSIILRILQVFKKNVNNNELQIEFFFTKRNFCHFKFFLYKLPTNKNLCLYEIDAASRRKFIAAPHTVEETNIYKALEDGAYTFFLCLFYW